MTMLRTGSQQQYLGDPRVAVFDALSVMVYIKGNGLSDPDRAFGQLESRLLGSYTLAEIERSWDGATISSQTSQESALPADVVRFAGAAIDQMGRDGTVSPAAARGCLELIGISVPTEIPNQLELFAA